MNSIKFNSISKGKFNQFINYIEILPLKEKIIYIIIPFIFTYIFTELYFNLPLSIIFAIITFMISFLFSKLIATIFIILYIVLVVDKYNQTNSFKGKPFSETDIISNNEPFNCINNSLVIDKKNIFETNINYFTYSFWLYINGTNNNLYQENWYSYRYDEWKSIFYRGSSITDKDLSNLIQYPGFWLTPNLNNLVIVFQNNSEVERIEIDNIELNKWVNIVTVIELGSVSVYINGKLDRVLNLDPNTINMNQYNLYISKDSESSSSGKSGFSGSIAELIYYNYALTNLDISKSYEYYKNIIDKYQNNIIKQNNNGNFNIKLIKNDDKI